MKGSLGVCLVVTILVLAMSKPAGDSLENGLPGYPDTFKNNVFAGYLSTSSELRSLHYVFVEHSSGPANNVPIVMWMNGGPGCFSKYGLVQQIGHYCLSDTQRYKPADNLTFNPWSWGNLSNLLFIDAPAGTGFSINNDNKFVYNDPNTASDNLYALKYFFRNKFPEYINNTFYLAGESYAGKYIPDLALGILNQKPQTIQLKGVLIGNGVLSLHDLHQSQVQWMISHNFIDPKLIPYWERSCLTDSESAGCRYFYERYQDLLYRIDEYNIYDNCYGRFGPAQQSLLSQLGLKHSPFFEMSKKYKQPRLGEEGGVWCTYDKGIEDYLNINYKQLNANITGISVCNMSLYEIYASNPKGSMSEMASLLQKGIKVYLFSGDWDDVVPFTDTFKNLGRLGLKVQGTQTPFMVGGQHAGFKKKYSLGLIFYMIKGAAHEVPLYQRQRAYQMFKEFMADPGPKKPQEQ